MKGEKLIDTLEEYENLKSSIIENIDMLENLKSSKMSQSNYESIKRFAGWIYNDTEKILKLLE